MTEDSERDFIKFSVSRVDTIADRVKAIRLEPVDRSPVAAWPPGAHLDIRIDSATVRQYSLCNDRSETHGYMVGVLLDPASRGGSAAMHQLAEGDTVEVRGPKNNFELVPASRYIFFAGGIGITPIVPMIRHAADSGIPWSLVYGARNRPALAFQSELESIPGGALRFVPEDTHGRINFEDELSQVEPSAAIYACGPTPMLDALTAACASLGIESQLHMERFTGSGDVPVHQPADTAFEVELARTGVTVKVESDQTIVDAVLPMRPDLPYSCLEGYCGTCETKVLTGVPEHRDEYLSEAQRATNATMLICVGRAKAGRLVLDL